TATLGVDFSVRAHGPEFPAGVFVGMHGSWNRSVPVGYKVVFVPFRNGRPYGDPIDFVTGFRDDDNTYGRPVGVTVDPRGALIVADDLANIIWRVTPTRPFDVPQAEGASDAAAGEPGATGGDAVEPGATDAAEPVDGEAPEAPAGSTGTSS